MVHFSPAHQNYLGLYGVQLLILPTDLQVHICCHVFQVSKNISDTLKVFLHFILTCITRYSKYF